MNYIGVTKKIMYFCEVITVRISAGLAQVNVLLSTLMVGLSAANIADADMQSKMIVPEMESKGFLNSFSTVVTVCSSMILYGCIADVSIGKLFMSGIWIATSFCITMMLLVSIIFKKGYVPIRSERITTQKFTKVLKTEILLLCLPIIIIDAIQGIHCNKISGNCGCIFFITSYVIL